MAALIALKTEEQLEFTALGRLLELTDGNLGAHLLKLEEAGCLKVEKTFVDRKPRTYLKATHRGRAEFEAHVEALRELLGPVRRTK